MGFRLESRFGDEGLVLACDRIEEGENQEGSHVPALGRTRSAATATARAET